MRPGQREAPSAVHAVAWARRGQGTLPWTRAADHGRRGTGRDRLVLLRWVVSKAVIHDSRRDDILAALAAPGELPMRAARLPRALLTSPDAHGRCCSAGRPASERSTRILKAKPGEPRLMS